MIDSGFITGPAGSGKTYLLKEEIAKNPRWGLLTATTGIAARNLGPEVPTVNSALHYYDIYSLRRADVKGDLIESMYEIQSKHDRLVIDEASMLLREAFEIIYENAKQAGLGLVLSGDFLQLAPIVKPDCDTPPPYWAFMSEQFWAEEKNIVRLAKIHRQNNLDFLTGLNHLRAGRGAEAVPFLKRAGVKFTSQRDPNFHGVTLVGMNKNKDSFNVERYDRLPGPAQTYSTERWGDQRSEWYTEVPESVSIKEGTRVMVLRNLYDHQRKLVQANGDTGIVVGMDDREVQVKRDNGDLISVGLHKQDDSELIGYEWVKDADGKDIRISQWTEPTGSVTYMPLTHAWALTTHKAQGLSLDAVQIDLKDWMFNKAAMIYVAASRCRAPENVVMVGGDWAIKSKCKMDEEVRQWIQ